MKMEPAPAPAPTAAPIAAPLPPPAIAPMSAPTAAPMPALVTVRSADAFDVSGEVVRATVAHPDALKIERHLGAPRDASGSRHVSDDPFNHGAVILRRRTHDHAETITRVRVLRRHVGVEDGHELRPVRHRE